MLSEHTSILNAYSPLSSGICNGAASLHEASPETVELLRDFFSGPHGASALQTGRGVDRHKPYPLDCWDIYDATVDEQVC
jgi:hypothetical protein